MLDKEKCNRINGFIQHFKHLTLLVTVCPHQIYSWGLSAGGEGDSRRQNKQKLQQNRVNKV